MLFAVILIDSHQTARSGAFLGASPTESLSRVIPIGASAISVTFMVNTFSMDKPPASVPLTRIEYSPWTRNREGRRVLVLVPRFQRGVVLVSDVAVGSNVKVSSVSGSMKSVFPAVPLASFSATVSLSKRILLGHHLRQLL